MDCENKYLLTFQFPSLGRAGTLIHQTLDVIGQDAIVAQNTVHIDVIESVGVGFLGGSQAQAHGDKHQTSHRGLHDDGWKSEIEREKREKFNQYKLFVCNWNWSGKV